MITQYAPEMVDLATFGPPLRIDCSFAQFWAFENEFARKTGKKSDDVIENEPLVTFYGSNDFHHLTLALVRRFRQPFNIVQRHPLSKHFIYTFTVLF